MIDRTVLFIIRRQATPQSEPFWEKFDLKWRPGMNVISGLMDIAMNPVDRAGKPTTPILSLIHILYGLPPARIHRRLHQHDDPGSVVPSSAHPGGDRLEVDELAVGPFSSFQPRLCRPRAATGAHRLRAQCRLSASWGHWFHRIDRPALVGN